MGNVKIILRLCDVPLYCWTEHDCHNNTCESIECGLQQVRAIYTASYKAIVPLIEWNAWPSIQVV